MNQGPVVATFGSPVDIEEGDHEPPSGFKIVTAIATSQGAADRNLVYARAGYEVVSPQLNLETGAIENAIENTGFGIDGLTEACRAATAKRMACIVRVTPNPIDPSKKQRTIIARYTALTGFWVHVGTRTPLEAMVIETAEMEALEQGHLDIDAVIMGDKATTHLMWLLDQPAYIVQVLGLDEITACIEKGSQE
jgi:hypothetical protein